MVVAGVGAGVVVGWLARHGDEARVGGAFFGEAFRRFFFAAVDVERREAGKTDLTAVTTASQKDSSGNPSTRNAVSKATISDSVEE